jgi:hypothetical protein
MITFPIRVDLDNLYLFCYCASAFFTTLEIIGLAVLFFWPQHKPDQNRTEDVKHG